MSAEWIAHGLMDSIVDSFFPHLEIIEKEVMDIERLVFSVNDGTAPTGSSPATSESKTFTGSNATILNEKMSFGILSEKGSLVDLAKAPTKSTVPRPRFRAPSELPLLVRRIRRIVWRKLASIPRLKSVDPDSPNQLLHSTETIHRMARIRRLVTSLTRFLAVKSEVVAQVKKRLLATGEWSLGTGTEDDLDVFVYMGDVQGRTTWLASAGLLLEC